MSKKSLINYLIILLLFLVLFTTRAYATTVIGKDETLGSLKESLKALQKKEQDNKNKKTKTQSEINANKTKIKNAENELMKTQLEIGTIEEQIEHTNGEIQKLKNETENLLVLYQKLENENIYVTYATGASSMTELIMRIDAINQLTDYNEQQLNNLEMLIKNNEKLNVKLDGYKEKLDSNIIAYENSIEELGDELAELEEGAVTIQDEIQNMQALIKRYQNMGCKDDQLLTDCVKISDNSGWLKPVSKGKITSLYGYRSSPTANASSYHKGVDIGVSEGTSVYPTANGEVAAIVYPTTNATRCGGKKLYIWTYVNGKKYTYVYMHLMEIKVNVGDKVTTDMVVALSGGGPKANLTNKLSDNCTTGPHLHYGLASGGWYGYSKDTPLSSFNSHTMNPPGYPGLYQWFYSR